MAVQIAKLSGADRIVAARLTIVGSGQGSLSAHEYLAELPALAEAITAGTLGFGARAMPLADVEKAWAAAGTSQLIVLTPRPQPAGRQY
jgi:hypothetical protein